MSSDNSKSQLSVSSSPDSANPMSWNVVITNNSGTPQVIHSVALRHALPGLTCSMNGSLLTQSSDNGSLTNLIYIGYSAEYSGNRPVSSGNFNLFSSYNGASGWNVNATLDPNKSLTLTFSLDLKTYNDYISYSSSGHDNSNLNITPDRIALNQLMLSA